MMTLRVLMKSRIRMIFYTEVVLKWSKGSRMLKILKGKLWQLCFSQIRCCMKCLKKRTDPTAPFNFDTLVIGSYKHKNCALCDTSTILIGNVRFYMTMRIRCGHKS